MEVFAISPASLKPLWFLTAICVILLILLIVFVFVAYSSRNSRIEMDGNKIKFVGDFWGREIALDQLDSAAARILDLTKDTQYSLKRRTFGTGLPGYASGWFRLQNGEKALVYLTRRHDVVYVPTTNGYSLLLSVDQPERFIKTLQQNSH